MKNTHKLHQNLRVFLVLRSVDAFHVLCKHVFPICVNVKNAWMRSSTVGVIRLCADFTLTASVEFSCNIDQFTIILIEILARNWPHLQGLMILRLWQPTCKPEIYYKLPEGWLFLLTQRHKGRSLHPVFKCYLNATEVIHMGYWYGTNVYRSG